MRTAKPRVRAPRRDDLTQNIKSPSFAGTRAARAGCPFVHCRERESLHAIFENPAGRARDRRRVHVASIRNGGAADGRQIACHHLGRHAPAGALASSRLASPRWLASSWLAPSRLATWLLWSRRRGRRAGRGRDHRWRHRQQSGARRQQRRLLLQPLQILRSGLGDVPRIRRHAASLPLVRSEEKTHQAIRLHCAAGFFLRMAANRRRTGGLQAMQSERPAVAEQINSLTRSPVLLSCKTGSSGGQSGSGRTAPHRRPQ